MTQRPGGFAALRTRLVLAALTPLALFLAYLPLRAGLWVGARLGDLAWLTLPRRRAVALDNLTRALGAETTPQERARIGRESFRNLGMNLVEACVFYFRPPQLLLSRVEVRGADNLVAAAALGRGLLGLTAHGAVKQMWGWWFPIVVVVTGGPPGSIVGDIVIRRRLPK